MIWEYRYAPPHETHGSHPDCWAGFNALGADGWEIIAIDLRTGEAVLKRQRAREYREPDLVKAPEVQPA